MSIKAVNGAEHFCQLGTLYGKIGSASAAENEHIDGVFIVCYIVERINRDAFSYNFQF